MGRIIDRRRVLGQSGGGGGLEGFIDLGLPSGLLWADRNIGAEAPEEPGLYFSWGNTDGHAEGSRYNFHPATYDTTPGKQLTTDIPLSQDAANAYLGGSCRMPTRFEFQELYDNTDSEWTTLNDVAGRKFMKKSDHSVFIFFPAAGCYGGTTLVSRGSEGEYWSASRYSDSDGHYFYFNSGHVGPQPNYVRWYGFSVRAVHDAP